jgi:hypothetical protein
VLQHTARRVTTYEIKADELRSMAQTRASNIMRQ